MTRHALNWFEIPVLDFKLAKAFYSAIFDYVMPEMPMGPNTMGFFPHEQGKGIGGAIVRGKGYVPSAQGALVYLAAGKDLTAVLARVEAAGGRILVAKTPVAPNMGYYAMFADIEGNRLGLHSPN
ncbi:MAG: VOC family protein [Caldimonas sp.]